MLTNDSYPVYVTQGDRRFVVFKPSEKFIGDKMYFANFCQKMFAAEACKHFYHYLMNVDLSNWSAR